MRRGIKHWACKLEARNRGVDIVLETLANVDLSRDTTILANNGPVIAIGSRSEVTINPRELMGRRASFCVFAMWVLPRTKRLISHAGIFAGLENGPLRPVRGSEGSKRRVRSTRLNPAQSASYCADHHQQSYRKNPGELYRFAGSVAVLYFSATQQWQSCGRAALPTVSFGRFRVKGLSLDGSEIRGWEIRPNSVGLFLRGLTTPSDCPRCSPTSAPFISVTRCAIEKDALS